MDKKIIAANWKENPKSRAAALKLFEASARAAKAAEGIAMVVCPPSIFLEDISRAFARLQIPSSRLALGAQDAFWEEGGPFTGNVGPKMLKSLGIKYVIVGHSERRKWLHETDPMINRKIVRAMGDGLKVILCVGEPPEVRKKGFSAAKRFIKGQLKKDLQGVFGATARNDIIVAYEPIWAIGSGKNDNPRDAAEIAAFIKETVRAAFQRAKLTVKVLYGGSVNGKNAADYVQLDVIDGALVGGASLKAGEFNRLTQSIRMKK